MGLRDVPSGLVLTTRRLQLRPAGPDDEAALLRLLREPSVRRYLLDGEIVEIPWVRNEIAASTLRFANSSLGLWTVRLRSAEDETLGFAGFREFWEPPVLELTYGLDPRIVGHGYATEAAHAVCRFAFRTRRLTRVRAAVDLPNRRSRRVLERLGARVEKVTADGPDGTAFYVLELIEAAR